MSHQENRYQQRLVLDDDWPINNPGSDGSNTPQHDLPQTSIDQPDDSDYDDGEDVDSGPNTNDPINN